MRDRRASGKLHAGLFSVVLPDWSFDYRPVSSTGMIIKRGEMNNAGGGEATTFRSANTT
jgi:hypothetical protein